MSSILVLVAINKIPTDSKPTNKHEMKKLLILAAMTLTLLSFRDQRVSFSGKLVYVNTFADLKNNDITESMVSFFGSENNYFINDSNYKAYNENNNLLYLYNSATNMYYSCDVDKKTAEKINAETITAKKIKIKALNDKETICGYECSSIEVKTESGTTVYFFTPSIVIDKTNYSNHNYGEWNSCLSATNGAVPLKIVYTDKKEGYVWTCKAKEVTKLNLTGKDFEFPSDIKIMK